MRVVKEEKMGCGFCKAHEAIIYCDGCEIPLCEKCRDFDLWAYGCGHVNTKVFCPVCKNSVRVNPYGAWYREG
ncbi:MAG: hypothetical protein N2317_01450 [Syntrophales bacterium]|nr:hypothetical protein [Syntrophales bacterium]